MPIILSLIFDPGKLQCLVHFPQWKILRTSIYFSWKSHDSITIIFWGFTWTKWSLKMHEIFKRKTVGSSVETEDIKENYTRSRCEQQGDLLSKFRSWYKCMTLILPFSDVQLNMIWKLKKRVFIHQCVLHVPKY